MEALCAIVPGRRMICQETHRTCALAPSAGRWVVIANAAWLDGTHLSSQRRPTRAQSAGKEAKGTTTSRAHTSRLEISV